MNQNKCETCTYYCQHYGFYNEKLFKIYCGHCTRFRIKNKKPDSESCENYVQANPLENYFATKEYLSKALLDYILGMELLPEIHYAEENEPDC